MGDFDPKTGKPINNKGGYPDIPMKFDPNTGAPISSEYNFNSNVKPQSGNSKKEKKNLFSGFSLAGSSKGIIIGVVAVVIILMVIAGFRSGLLLNKANKILLAVNNTVKDEKFLQNLNFYNIVSDGDFKASVNGKINSNEEYLDGSSIDVIWQQNANNREYALDGKINIAKMASIDAFARIDKSKITFQVPTILDSIFMYSYTDKEKDGYIIEYTGSDVIDAVDEAIMEALEPREDYTKKMLAAISTNYKTLDIEEVDSEKFEINDKKRKCKGYKTTISSSEVQDLLEDLGNIHEDYYDDLAQNISRVSGQKTSYNIFDELKSKVINISDLDVTLYIYKNKLAAINAEVAGSSIELLFQGGDSRMQNMEISISDGYDKAIISKTASKKKDVEKAEINAYNGEESHFLVSYEYNYKTGEFELESGELLEGINAKGTIESNRKSFTVDLDSFSAGSDVSVNGNVSIKKGSNVKALSGDVFDLGNAREREILNLGNEIENKIESLFSDSILAYLW